MADFKFTHMGYVPPYPRQIVRKLSLNNRESFWYYGRRISRDRALQLHLENGVEVVN